VLALLLACLLPWKCAAATWTEDLPAALEAAKKTGSLVLLDFYAPWCYSCYYMDEHVLHEPEFEPIAKDLQLVKLDVDSAPGAEARDRYFARALPQYVVLNPAGEEVGRIRGEQTKDAFFSQLRELVASRSGLSELEAKARAGDADAAVLALRAHVKRETPQAGLKLLVSLGTERERAVEADPGGRLDILRLKLLAAKEEKNPETCERLGRVLLAGRTDCDVMYDVFRENECLASLPAKRRSKAHEAQAAPLEGLLSSRVFGEPAARCADLATAVEMGVEFYSTTGRRKKGDALLSKAIELLRAELGGDLGRDRNKADTLLDFLELGKRSSELSEYYPKLAAAYPKDYVYSYRWALFLLEHGDAAKALERLDEAKRLAYGAGTLRVARARARALAKLGRKEEALKELDAALKDHPASFPEQTALLEKTRRELNP
jgi:thiol-disulfide isomerase/thioredoxin